MECLSSIVLVLLLDQTHFKVALKARNERKKAAINK